jgi:hypoxanthine phosphoribosyltransferase
MDSPQFADRMSRILYSEDAIQHRVRELSSQITEDFTRNGFAQDAKQRPLVLIGVLRGAMVFLVDLARQLHIPVEYDLISMSSYENGTAPGAVRLVKDLDKAIEGRDVLLVEDIIDTGYTIEYLRRSFAARNPASFRLCTLVDKLARRERETHIDYAGFHLTEDAFIVGYGMDFAGLYRNLPYVGVLKPEYIHGH